MSTMTGAGLGWAKAMAAGPQALGPSSTVFPYALAGSYIGNRVART